MRPSSVVVLLSLLALSLLLTEAQGIRLKIGILSFGHDQPEEIHESKKMSNTMMKTSHEDESVGESITFTGMNRKLITTTTTTTSTTTTSTTTSKINEKNNEENKANPRSSSSLKSKSSSDHGESGLQGTNSSPPPSSHDDEMISYDHYHVDITDITEMDYSPARRKPPIHN